MFMEENMRVIIEEMAKGNFSFLILVIGVAQLIVMLKNYLENKKK